MMFWVEIKTQGVSYPPVPCKGDIGMLQQSTAVKDLQSLQFPINLFEYLHELAERGFYILKLHTKMNQSD